MMRQASAVAVLRPALGTLLLLNLVTLGLLVAALRPTISAANARGQLTVTGALALGMGVLMPMSFLLAGDGLLSVLGAAIGIFLGSFLIRSSIVRLPHLSS
jgi:hypothetical protein